MDTKGFVEMLNQDLSTEYQSIVQYTNHVATITGAEYLSIVDELKLHLSQELGHAQILATQVSFLGGSPTTTVATGRRRRRQPIRRSRPTCGWSRTSSTATGSGSPRPTTSGWPTWPRRSGRCWNRPRSTSAICRPRWASDQLG